MQSKPTYKAKTPIQQTMFDVAGNKPADTGSSKKKILGSGQTVSLNMDEIGLNSEWKKGFGEYIRNGRNNRTP
jgi:hypothetical protein